MVKQDGSIHQNFVWNCLVFVAALGAPTVMEFRVSLLLQYSTTLCRFDQQKQLENILIKGVLNICEIAKNNKIVKPFLLSDRSSKAPQSAHKFRTGNP